MHKPILLALSLAFLGSGCARHAVHEAPAPEAAATPVPGYDNLNAVAWTQTSTEHDLIYRQVYVAASQELDRALADPTWDALDARDRPTPPAAGLPTAIILDIDETVLDNGPYQARLVVDQTFYGRESWAAWCREAKARALPGAVEFTNLAASKGVTVFYLSNRDADLDAPTLANLRQVGFPVAHDEVFLGRGMVTPGCTPKGSDKGCRRQYIASQYRVLMQFGDQLGDFLDIDTNTPAGRSEVVAPYLNWIGERWFVLPNPTYGHWEPALFDNNWSQTPEERRKAKLSNLDTAR